MMVGLLEGAFRKILVWITGARRILEIGMLNRLQRFGPGASTARRRLADHL